MRDVTAQPFEALLLFHGGAVAGLLYLLLRVIRSRFQRKSVTHLTDAVFILTCGAIFAGYLYLANFGIMRAFLAAAFCLGFAAVYILFSSVFAAISQKIRKK